MTIAEVAPTTTMDTQNLGVSTMGEPHHPGARPIQRKPAMIARS
jgi:hypothetical protein